MPGDFITDFLNDQYNSFSQRNISQDELCTLRSFAFSGESPDYTDSLHREFYFLKYASAYITEYFLAYERIFSSDHLSAGDSVCTLSLGCGAMLDLVGFEYARQQSENFCGSRPIYYGVDIIVWDCSETKIIDDFYESYDGIENFDSNNSIKYDIICFPKSISDIGEARILDFAESLTSCDVSDRICIIVSKRGNSIDDANNAENFVEILCKNIGFSFKKEIFNVDEDEYFENILENSFLFNNQIGWNIRSLGQRCAFCDCEENLQSECEQIIGKWPMRKAFNVHPEIYYLEKK